MNAQEAIKVLAGKANGSRDAARTALAAAVIIASDYGDPDDSIMDWIAAGSYDGSETVKSIAAEWDERE